MKTNMEDIDKLIKETLTQEEAKFYEELGEQGLLGSFKSIFKGKDSWLVIIMNIVNILVFGLLIYCIIQTFEVQDTNELIIWIALIFVCFMVMGMIKLYVWMKIDKNTILREMKRLELQISSLSGRMSN
ncbi:hypothetical protein MBM09_07515 [Flaviramulus sp. BrNp1-15]|uniref:DUF6768 family protein n=1 Tax=Flaviramulus sp. BrNp1-15 TaxID=2916754 RepID=UPI001EE89C6F|nr:DUF6768 family protein [Flaviramulus sp. BrNp1-15]ULC60838.1 hypothetical protein MBM09_07515 [Flaviramulus sp. BrNp1-15]